MTDWEGRRNRLGAGFHSLEMRIEGVLIHCCLNNHPKIGRTEVVKIMPCGVPDPMMKDVPDEDSAWPWVRNECRLRRLP
jgi:hypothetical protein